MIVCDCFFGLEIVEFSVSMMRISSVLVSSVSVRLFRCCFCVLW